MKYCFLMLLFSIQAVSAQTAKLPPIPIPIDSTTGAAQFREVQTLEKPIKVDALISAARTWATKTYRDANKVIQQDDPAAGVLIVKGIFDISYVSDVEVQGKFVAVTNQVRHTLMIEAKQGRYRATMDGFSFEVAPNAFFPSGMSTPLNLKGCILSGNDYKQYALDEMDRLGLSAYKKDVLKQYAKDPETGMNDSRKRCLALKKQAIATLESLKASLIKASKDSDW